MLLDRDAFIDTFFNVGPYQSAGLPVESRWHTHYAAGEAPYWIDPKGKGLGEGATYFQHNPAEATKLMRAAGFNQPIRIPGYVGSVTRQLHVFQEMIQNGNLFAIDLTALPTNEFNNRVFNGGGLHDGLGMAQLAASAGDIDNQISVRFNVTVNAPQCLYRTVFPWYQKTQRLIEAQRVELDEKKRLGLLEELQKEMALQMPAVPYPGIANGFSLAWPFLGNFNVFTPRTTTTAPAETWPSYWYDASKRV
jgi:ABC-type transport system substrate-binding protein